MHTRMIEAQKSRLNHGKQQAAKIEEVALVKRILLYLLASKCYRVGVQNSNKFYRVLSNLGPGQKDFVHLQVPGPGNTWSEGGDLSSVTCDITITVDQHVKLPDRYWGNKYRSIITRIHGDPAQAPRAEQLAIAETELMATIADLHQRKRISASGMPTLEDLVDPEDECDIGNAQFKVQTDAEIVAAVCYEEAVARGDVMEVDSEEEGGRAGGSWRKPASQKDNPIRNLVENLGQARRIQSSEILNGQWHYEKGMTLARVEPRTSSYAQTKPRVFSSWADVDTALAASKFLRLKSFLVHASYLWAERVEHLHLTGTSEVDMEMPLATARGILYRVPQQDTSL
ncbi:hypothetical protein B0H14DRAFT_3169844 [Mycena olivaceomarginata]|nr:hypothetical protein B0H14DRAFT_3169844 [Mycena olivaceomarginata]